MHVSDQAMPMLLFGWCGFFGLMCVLLAGMPGRVQRASTALVVAAWIWVLLRGFERWIS